MKYIKIYENYESDVRAPKVGDYVICKKDYLYDTNFEEYIGEIILIDKLKIPYKIRYEKLGDYWWFGHDDILFFSSDKKQCELYIDANKYNI